MKRLLIALVGSFVLFGAQAQEPFYEIDPVATADAQWEIGGIMGKDACDAEEPCNCIFLGITTDGKTVVQVFFPNGNKYTDPYLNIILEGTRLPDGRVRLAPLIDGPFVVWYENGQKEFEGLYRDDQMEGVWRHWHENGEKEAEGSFQDGRKIGIWRWWLDDGTLDKEKDYGTPEDQPT